MSKKKEKDKSIGHNNNQSKKISSSSPPVSSLIAYAGPHQVVYEGTTVTLEGTASRSDPDSNLPLSYSWVQTDDTNTVRLNDPNTANPTFEAPYVEFNLKDKNIPKNPYTKLKFQLTVKDQSGKSSPPSIVNITVKMVQRALVFQGGGALGAYEAGVFEELCNELIKKDRRLRHRQNRPVFDIIAGSSIGAVNAALIVYNVIRSNSSRRNDTSTLEEDTLTMWERAIQQLNRFWDEISFPIWWLEGNLFDTWWKNWNEITTMSIEGWKKFFEINKETFAWRDMLPYSLYYLWPDRYVPMASPEAARRYFSWIYFLFSGAPGVMSENFPQPDTKFFANIPPFSRFDNSPLTRTMKKYWDYDNDNNKIKTSFDNGEPRLLLVCVDAMDASSAVTFDSYLCKTKYLDGKAVNNKDTRNNNEQDKEAEYYTIDYPNGISIEHVTASMSPNARYKYPKFRAESKREGKKDHYFWDGAYLSNTPLREVIQSHRDYWYKVKESEVPHLEVYIVNLYPTVEETSEIPHDADTIQDREVDIRFHDRTQYDVEVAQMITDYLILNGQVKNLALKYLAKSGKKELLDSFLEELEEDLLVKKDAISRSRGGLLKENDNTKKRKYRDLVEGRFDIANVVYINRKDDGYTIFGKASEFSTKTIETLRQQGREAAKEVINQIKY
jgi:NTE family protein